MPEVLGSLRPPRLPSSGKPASPIPGEIYFDTTTLILYYWDGSAWISTKSAAGTIYDSDQVGTVKTFAGKTIPTNWMIADGRSLPTATYPDLFTAIGYTYGGSGANFNLPDLRSKFLYGAAQSDLSDVAAQGGEASHILSAAEMPVHSHTVNSHSHGGAVVSGGAHDHGLPDQGVNPPIGVYTDNGAASGLKFGTAATGVNFRNWGVHNGHQHTINAESPGTNSQGGGAAHENMPPYIKIAFIIKVMGAQINAGGALQGATGAKGDPGPWRGAWNAGSAYAVGDSVSYYDGSVTGTYRRKVAGTTAGDPKTDTTNWEIIASGGSIGANGAPGVNGYTPVSRAYGSFTYAAADNAHRIYTPTIAAKPFDQIGGFPAVGGALVFTAPVAGKYLVVTKVAQVVNTGQINVSPIINDSTPGNGTTALVNPKADGSETGGCENSNIFDLAAGATIKLFSCHSGGGAAYLIYDIVRLDASTAWGGAPLVTSLPASPTDGQEVYFVADATNGIIWHLRYRAAAPGSYKWEFVGGPPMFAAWDDTSAMMNITSNAWTDANDGHGPSIAVPLKGDYRAEWGARQSGPAGGFAMSAPKFGANATRDQDWCSVGAGIDVAASKYTGGTCANAGDIIKLQYRNYSGSGNAGFQTRWLSVLPVRVG